MRVPAGSPSAARRLISTLAAAVVLAVPVAAALGQGEPWANDAAVQQVLELRRKGIAAMTSVGASAESERYSSTFVANTPGNAVVKGEQMLEQFARGTVSYAAVEKKTNMPVHMARTWSC